MNGMKIGIFGGTFNPPHLGHLRLVRSAADTLGLDKVLIIPTCVPVHKQAKQLALADDRLEMCRLGLCPDPRFEVSGIEIDRGEKSYTVDTLEALGKEYPGAEFYLIIGSDMVSSFTCWHRWQDILDMAYVCGAAREKGFLPELDCYTAEQKKRFIFLSHEPLVLSSSEIRKHITAGESTDGMLDPSVRSYIERRGIYTPDIDRYHRLIEERLDPKRLYHCECVAECARTLAKRFGADPDKAQLAGLLHDVMKNASQQEQCDIIARTGIVLSREERANPKVLHAIAGEAFLRLETDIDDEGVLSAVRWHTTGRAGMTKLEKVVYIADFIAADRTYPDVDEVRSFASISLDSAILYTTRYTIQKLASQSTVIHRATLDCYNDILLGITGGKDE